MNVGAWAFRPSSYLRMERPRSGKKHLGSIVVCVLASYSFMVTIFMEVEQCLENGILTLLIVFVIGAEFGRHGCRVGFGVVGKRHIHRRNGGRSAKGNRNLSEGCR